MKQSSYYSAVIIAILLWGSSFIATKIATEAISPILLCMLRFAIAGAILFGIRLAKSDLRKPDRKDLPKIMLSSVIGISLYYALENTAITLTSASTAALISGAYPAMTALVGLLCFHVKTGWKKMLGIAMAMIGVFVITDMTGGENGSMLGNGILIIDGLLWAFYNFLIPRIDPKYSTLTLTYYQTLFGVLFLIPAVILEKPTLGTITPEVTVAVIFLAVFCSVAAYMLYNYGLKGIPAANAAAIMNLMPVVGVLLSAWILSEPLTLKHLLGGAVIILGVMISTKE